MRAAAVAVVAGVGVGVGLKIFYDHIRWWLTTGAKRPLEANHKAAAPRNRELGQKVIRHNTPNYLDTVYMSSMCYAHLSGTIVAVCS